MIYMDYTKKAEEKYTFFQCLCFHHGMKKAYFKVGTCWYDLDILGIKIILPYEEY